MVFNSQTVERPAHVPEAAVHEFDPAMLPGRRAVLHRNLAFAASAQRGPGIVHPVDGRVAVDERRERGHH